MKKLEFTKEMLEDLQNFKQEDIQSKEEELVKSGVKLFSIQDIKDAYDLGRAHERNGSDCTSEIVGNAWLRAEILNKNIKWE